MNRATALCLAAVCFWSANSAAHADQISYSFSTNYPSVAFHGNHFDGVVLAQNSGTLNHIATSNATISPEVIAFSTAPQSKPDNITAAIKLTLTDKTSGGQTLHDTVTVGTLSGSMSLQGSNLTFTSSGPKTVPFGSANYIVSFNSGSIHSLGWLVSAGTLSFTVKDPPNGSPSSAPEPSSFVLASIGLPLFGLFLRRGKRGPKHPEAMG